MKSETHLTKAQIEEIPQWIKENVILEYENDMMNRYGQDWKKHLTEKFGEPNEPEEWPKYKGEYFYIDDHGQWRSDIWEHTPVQWARKDIGNLYRTKEAAEAKVELMRHVQNFEKPLYGDECYFLNQYERWKNCCGEDSETGKIRYESWWIGGLIIPLSSTEADRTERIRLLKLCYAN